MSTPTWKHAQLAPAVEHEKARAVEELARALAALAYPARLELVELLREPRRVPEIHLRARRQSLVELGANRRASRQTVENHMAKLLRAGLAREEPGTPGPAGTPTRFVLDAGRLVWVADALRALASRHALAGRPPPSQLRFLTGARAGEVLDLEPRRDGAAGCTVTAAPSAGSPRDAARAVVDVREMGMSFGALDRSADGAGAVLLNGQPLSREARVALTAGDVLTVGDALLVFRIQMAANVEG